MTIMEPHLLPVAGSLCLLTCQVVDTINLTDSRINSALHLTDISCCTLCAFPKVVAMLQPTAGSDDQL